MHVSLQAWRTWTANELTGGAGFLDRDKAKNQLVTL
jgi:hypothetical protein